jgi:hypothetical protein
VYFQTKYSKVKLASKGKYWIELRPFQQAHRITEIQNFNFETIISSVEEVPRLDV